MTTVSTPGQATSASTPPEAERGRRRSAMPLAISLLLGVVALTLPPHASAVALVGQHAAVLAAVVTGVWIFKLVLGLHAVLLLAASRVPLAGGDGQPLAAIRFSPVQSISVAEQRILIALLAAALILRLVALDAGLWFDEIRTLVGYIRLPVGQIVATYDSQNQHFLYSLMSRAVVAVMGEGAAALRVPAVVFGVASVGALYWFGSLVTSRREALLASALLTFSYHHVWFSQNARGYTALLFFTLLSSGLLLRLLALRSAQSWKPVVLYAVVMALAVFTHVTAVLIAAAHAVIWTFLLLRARSRMSERTAWLPLAGFVLAATIALQLYALVLPQFLDTLLKPATPGIASEWKSPLWFIAETVRGLSQGIPGGLVTLAGATVIGLAGTVSYLKQDRSILMVMLLPGVLTAVAVFATEHNLWPRFFFFCAGFALLIAVRGTFVLATRVAGSRGPLLATVAVALLTVGSALTVPRAWAAKQDYDGARAYVERERAPSDAVVTVDLSSYPYSRYYQTNWLNAVNAIELESIEQGHSRTWVLYTFPARLSAAQPEIWERLQRVYRTAAEFPGTVGGGAVIVKVHP